MSIKVLLVSALGVNEPEKEKMVASLLETYTISGVYTVATEAALTLAGRVASLMGLPVQTVGDPTCLGLTELVGSLQCGTIVLVADEKTTQIFIANWLGIPKDSVHIIRQEHCAVNSLVFHGNRVVIETVNDVCHIQPSN